MKNREILFRGKRIDNGEWVYGHYYYSERYECHYIHVANKTGKRSFVDADVEVDSKTISQFTGLTDKNDKKIFERDLIQIRRPIRTTQTHTGDNIPNGSYTEPLEAAIETTVEEVIFRDGCFCLDNQQNSELKWEYGDLDINDIKHLIDYGSRTIFESNEDLMEDIEYLLDEYELKDIEDLCDYVSGVINVGNIHDNPELLK